ncbi:glutamate-rich WD repeat-containing protein [Achlya hypogyna]|uniref:Glutamate-rich WD repeat-containing protein 1 n=1 Tax=Achlya hypogyna TaxID=1202772 RepID=A0A1V9YKA1_ACHHY|nr:glutamate-rich WD repeat-containing protein [Achlya hypogyna]
MKRGVESVLGKKKARGEAAPVHHVEETEEDLVFEDPYGDDLEDEEMISEDAGDDDEEERDEDDMDVDTPAHHIDGDDEKEPATKVWLPNKEKLGEDEVLDYDSSAYDLYYAMSAEWPSLSFDIVRDNLGAVRTKFPMSIYMVAGTQAAKAADNKITIMKMTELHKTKHDDDSDDSDADDSDDDAEEGDPVLESRSIEHHGGVNRIRSMPQSSNIVATWADTRKVHLFDISKQLQSLDGKNPVGMSSTAAPIFTFTGHADEGFAMDWSPHTAGSLLTGDCSKYIYHWVNNGSSWVVDKIPFTGHKASVEDIQWSPLEGSVFASCSADKTLRIWDIRTKNRSMIDINAHDQDVNVISWNRNVAHLIASGSDDGSFKIWDCRKFGSAQKDDPIAHFRYHTAPVTSIEWHPSDESMLAVSGADNQISIWDMSVEEDAEHTPATEKLDVPPQLLFIHQGQTDIKELHFHPQCPGLLVSTAGDGFNVFKPANIS